MAKFSVLKIKISLGICIHLKYYKLAKKYKCVANIFLLIFKQKVFNFIHVVFFYNFIKKRFKMLDIRHTLRGSIEF